MKDFGWAVALTALIIIGLAGCSAGGKSPDNSATDGSDTVVGDARIDDGSAPEAKDGSVDGEVDTGVDSGTGLGDSGGSDSGNLGTDGSAADAEADGSETDRDDSDGDGIVDDDDPSPDDPNVCGDSDQDSCDDCSTGHFDPDDDGADSDEDGLCDACDENVCSGNGSCQINDDTISCECDEGWTDDDCGHDIDECDDDDNPCDDEDDPSATCDNTDGGYTCTCSSDGFDGSSGVCVDIDECEDDDNPCDDEDDSSATCDNTDGSYTCTCSSDGFDGTSGVCLDIDECIVDDNPCDDGDDPSATCDDIDGSYTCICSSDGFDGASGVCLDIDECTVDDNPCDDGDDPSATCDDIDGGYTCTCSGDGFDGSSGVCLDIDECTVDDNPCDDGDDPSATCDDIDGGYTCTCSSDGFDGSSGVCIDINECIGDHPCDDAGDSAASCNNVDGGYTCDCSSGIGGLNCDTYYASCQAILQASLAEGDGLYIIDPEGGNPFEVYCDMTTDGGGWTAVTAAAANGGFISTMTALGGGSCDLNVDNPIATDTTDGIICRYDMDLGFDFNHIRLSDVQITVRSNGSHTSDLSYNTNDWGTTDCHASQTGDVRLGTPAASSAALSLGAANGETACTTFTSYASGDVIDWVDDAYTATDQVLRLEMTETGPESEGWEWTAGTIFVREEVVLEGAGVSGDPISWSNGTIASSCEAYRRPAQYAYFYNGSTGNGVYLIDPDDTGPIDAFEVYCQMQTDGGGWTLLGVIAGGDADNWNTQYGYWSDASMLGSVGDINSDYKSQAWNDLDISGGEVLFERQYNGDVEAQTILGSACLNGESSFAALFASPTDVDLACTRWDIQTLVGSAIGVASGQYQEGNGIYALGGDDTNGFCWNGGDTDTNIFNGHLLWNQSDYPDTCLAAGHLGGLGVYENSHSQFENTDITDTNWLNGVNSTLVVIRLYVRDTIGLAGAGTQSSPFQPISGTAEASCLDYLNDSENIRHSGYYLVDPDGAGGIDAQVVYCDMVRQGGGWQRVLEWNREKDPSVYTLASLQSAMTDEVDILVQGGADISTMGDLQDDTDHIQWSDYDASYDALSYMLDISTLARDEVMVDLRYHGESMEDSGVWFYTKGNIQTVNLACSDDTPVGSFTADELALIPYTCPVSTGSTWNWDDTYVGVLSEAAQSVHIRSLHADSGFGDESRLYRFDVFVR